MPLLYPPIPLIGLGTWELCGTSCERIVAQALEIGYRHIDTALLYENHDAIGRAIAPYPREELFLTSKVLPEHLIEETVTQSCARALRELNVDYLDLFLLHYPDRRMNMEVILTELSSLIDAGLTRFIGVSNFTIAHLKDLLPLQFPLSVNQVEYHPYLNQRPLLTFCHQQGIRIVSYRSLGKGALTQDPIFHTIGAAHRKTAVQVCLRWLVQQHIPVIPKTTSPTHLKENFDIFDFTLTHTEMEQLSHLSTQKRFCQNKWSDFEYTH